MLDLGDEEGSPGGKKPRVAEDRGEADKARAMLAMSRYCQEEWVRSMVRLHMFREDRVKFALLSGDAGCGKSYAISLLEAKMRALEISVVVSAMTNKAAGTLMESTSLESVHTFHKMMGFKRELLDDELTSDDFVARYRAVHRSAIARFKAFCDSDDPVLRSSGGHSCERPRPGSCAVCSRAFGRLRDSRRESSEAASMDDAPPFLGVNVLVVDEYGLMTANLLERMVRVVALFYGEDRGPLIIMAGSVSQLQPAGSGARVWETDALERLLASSTPLFVNRRQFEDPGYAEALSYLQFNTVTAESRSIFKSRILVSHRDATDPSHEPEKMRIFHQDEQLSSYTAAYVGKAAEGSRLGETFLNVSRTRSGSTGPKAWYEVLKQAAQALPKLFSVPRYRPGGRPVERDYLRTGKLWVGCKVRMIWHMDQNGIRPMRDEHPSRPLWDKAVKLSRSNAPSQARDAKPFDGDTEGVVRGIRFNRRTRANEFTVKGSRTGRTYSVGPSAWHCANWTVTAHPLACLFAMNTYDCQGSTVTGDVIYHPPWRFDLSPIKPSVYVALSRVTSRERIQMTNCNFAETVGEVRFLRPEARRVPQTGRDGLRELMETRRDATRRPGLFSPFFAYAWGQKSTAPYNPIERAGRSPLPRPINLLHLALRSRCGSLSWVSAKMESRYATWHELTLEGLIRLASSKHAVASTDRYRRSSSGIRSVGRGSRDETRPPRAEERDDLMSYVTIKWCPWFSRTFGELSEANVNMLTFKILSVHSEEAPVALELLVSALLVLKLPNASTRPTFRDPSLGDCFLFSASAT